MQKKNSMTSESGKYSVDLKRIRDWMKNFEICRMKQNASCVKENESVKSMFDKTIDDPVVKDIFIASPGCIHKFTKRHQLSCIKKKKNGIGHSQPTFPCSNPTKQSNKFKIND